MGSSEARQVEVVVIDTTQALFFQPIDDACFAQGERTNIAEELKKPFTHAWGARFQRETTWLGYLITWFVADELHILNIATSPNYRRCGIGRTLLEQALHFAKNNGVRLILLEVRKSNQAAIQLYRAFGFTVLSIRRGYYSNNGEDALEMALALNPETGEIVPSRDEERLEEV